MKNQKLPSQNQNMVKTNVIKGFGLHPWRTPSPNAAVSDSNRGGFNYSTIPIRDTYI